MTFKAMLASTSFIIGRQREKNYLGQVLSCTLLELSISMTSFMQTCEMGHIKRKPVSGVVADAQAGQSDFLMVRPK